MNYQNANRVLDIIGNFYEHDLERMNAIFTNVERYNLFRTAINIIHEDVKAIIDHRLPDNLASTYNSILHGEFRQLLADLREVKEVILNNTVEKEKLLDRMQNASDTIFDPGNADPNLPYCRAVIEAVKSTRAEHIEELNTVAQDQLKEISDIRQRVENVAERVVRHQYADIFLRQAHRHAGVAREHQSVLQLGGAAARWFVMGILALCSGGAGLWYLVDTQNSNYERIVMQWLTSSMQQKSIIDRKKPANRAGMTHTLLLTVYFSEIGIRAAFFLVWMFILRFCFRQFDQNRKMYAANLHRQNILNSFGLLLDSIGDDSAVRNSLILEVARATYLETVTTGSGQPKPVDSSTVSDAIKVMGGFKN